MNEQKILEVNCVDTCNAYFGMHTRNPMVSVIDLSQIECVTHMPKRFGIHSISCLFDSSSNDESSDDGFVATMSFYAPGHYGRYSTDTIQHPKGYILVFDERVAKDTIYENRIRDFVFFSSQTNNTVRLTAQEADMVVNCIRSIDIELNNEIDYYSSRILISGIAVLLSLSMRYYNKHHSHNDDKQNIIARLNNVLDEYLRKPHSENKEIPTVSSIAKQIGITPNYLGDSIRKHGGCSAHDYIRSFIMKEARRLLMYSKLSINTIAYNLGYKYPHHFTRVFKQEYGVTPIEFRKERKR